MHKTGKIKFFLCTLLIIAALAIIGCDNDDHTHTFSDFWAYNSAQHWQPSTCNHNAKRGLGDHEFSASVTLPDENNGGYTTYSCACGYSYIGDKVDPLPGERGELRFNESGHWQPVIGDNEQPNVIEHDFDDEAVAPTCTSFGYTKHTCKECAYWTVDTPVNPVEHEIENDIWEHDGDCHWHPCLKCGGKYEPTMHVFTEQVTEPTCDTDGYTEFNCAECGYTHRGRIVAKRHTYSEEFDGDEYNHWLKPSCEHEDAQPIEASEHVLVGKSSECVICKKHVAERLGFTLSADGSYYIVSDIGCVSTATVDIPEQYRDKPVKEIAARAFADENVSSVAIPSTVTSIGTRAFAGTKITSVTLPASVEEIGNGIFANCTALQTVTVNCNLDAIAPYTFDGCTSLTAVTAEHKPTQIGAFAFSGCKQLTTMDISDCTVIGFAAFDGCEEFEPDIPEALTLLDEYAFAKCKVSSVTLPETLSEVGGHAFEGCASLDTLTVNATVIGEFAFAECSALDNVTLAGTERILDSAFKDCAALGTLDLPGSVLEVCASAFDGTALGTTSGDLKIAANVVVAVSNKNITSVTVPDGVVGIADEVFRGCENLSSVTLGSVRFIGKSAFRKNTALKSIAFTASVKYIGANAFRESGLTSVTIPATVDSVGDNAFYDCKSLTSADINAKVIGKFAFSYTGVDRDLNSPVKKRPAYAVLASVTLGENVQRIGSNAFQYCPITQVTLPSGLVEIGKYAFAQTDIAGITVPASVTRIGEYAFYESKLTSATFELTTGWKAGKHSLSLSAAAQNANMLKDTYKDIDWIKE